VLQHDAQEFIENSFLSAGMQIVSNEILDRKNK
jgi:hypothetical protein